MTLMRSLVLSSFACLLAFAAQPASAEEPERLFLQQVGSKSAIVKWRGGDADQVCYSRWPFLLKFPWWPACKAATETELGHLEVELRHLRPDRTYYYILGEPGPGAFNPEQYFRTAPRANRAPRDGNTHIWLVGDSGTETEVSPFTGEFTHPGEA